MALGSEPVRVGDRLVGRVTSGGYGYTVERSIAYAYLPAADAAIGTRVAVEIFGDWVEGEVAAEPLFDPDGSARVRALAGPGRPHVRRPQGGERIGDRECLIGEGELLGGTPAGPARVAAAARRHERTAADEHALEVRRRDVVAERRRVDVAELVQREGRRREREADVRVRQLAAQAVARRVDDRAVVERGGGRRSTGCQLVSGGTEGSTPSGTRPR